MELTTKEIIKKIRTFVNFCAFGIFFVAGIFSSIVPFTNISPEANPEDIKMLTIFILLFGFLFWYIIGLRNMIKVLRRYFAIKSGKFYIFEDVLIEKDSHRRGDSRNYYLYFLNYINATNHAFNVNPKDYKSARVGEVYFLIKPQNSKKVVAYFPKSEFYLGSELRDKLSSVEMIYNKLDE